MKRARFFRLFRDVDGLQGLGDELPERSNAKSVDRVRFNRLVQDFFFLYGDNIICL